MGVPLKSEAEGYTDHLAALLTSDLAGLTASLANRTQSSLADQVAASVDAEVKIGLLAAGLAVDQSSLPESYAALLSTLFSRAAYRGFLTSLDSQVQTYGGYANLRAYLADKGAVINPLVAECLRQANRSDALFTDANGDVTTVFAPDYSTINADRAYTGTDGALVDDTVDVQDAGTADVALFAANGDAIYLGSTRPFTQLVAALSTLASTTITPTFAYWNGSAWAGVPGLTDNSVGFTKNDTVKWTLPSDWERCAKDAGGIAFADKTPRYYLRVNRGAAVLATPPVATCIRLVPTLLADGGRHLPVPQPPLALLRITGAATLVVEALTTVDFARFIEPGIRFRALTPFAVSPVVTLFYVNQAAAEVSQAQTPWPTPAALATRAVTLNGADTGASSVLEAGNTVSSGAQGVIEVYASAQETLARTPAL